MPKRLLLVFFLLSYVYLYSIESFAEDIFNYAEKGDVEETSLSDVFSNLDESKIKYSNVGNIIILNKITSNSKEFAVNVKSKVSYGKAELELHKCAKTQKDESILLVTLREMSLDKEKTIIFRGWLFSNNLSLSSPSHPVYQVVAVSCS